MLRNITALVLLMCFTFAIAALAQIRAGAPLPMAQGENAKPLVAKAQTALDAKRWPEAEATLKQLLSSDSRWEYSEALGNAQFNQGHYADSVATYERAINLALTKANPGVIGRMYMTIGNANLKLNKKDEAISAYGKAAVIDPNPAVAYFNICAIMYNLDQTSAKTVAACDKAIAADPNKADAYFIKGSALFGSGSLQNGKFIVGDTALQALRKYLVLAPNGPHAADVNAMLDAVK